ncbi:MAG TPA: SDR family oxidoreductase [Caldimonas sp.]|jgi:NAD(P)-dependent dehydrogenase (short-subunit alcohol dehydrogenase family)|nr:SDR family oxidoreductase [Caldimonas sp.]
MRFRDQVVIVTGGAGGIGLATARCFGAEGAHVVSADFDEAKGLAAQAILRDAGIDAISLRCDVANEGEVARVVALTLARFGRLDVIVNNAGTMIFKPIEAHDEADLLGVMRVDFFGAFWFVKHAFLNCRPGAAIVNVSSIHAVETTPLASAYAAAKAALLSLTRSAAIEGRPKGIRVNAVLPGAIETPMLRDNPDVKSGVEQLAPGDVGRPANVAAAIAFLASAEAAFVTGAELRVDGGRLARL